MIRKPIALIAPLALGLALAAPAAASGKQCHVTGHVLARHGSAVLWSQTKKQGKHYHVSVYLCSPPKPGRHVLVASGNSSLGPVVHRVKSAGHFLAFLLTTGSNRYASLFVYNVATGRKELSDFDTCSGPTEASCANDPYLTTYVLGSSGWIAELFTYPSGFGTQTFPTANYQALVAADNATSHYPIDLGYSIDGLSLSGSSLTWSSDLGGSSSVTLGSALVTPSSSQPLSACQALTQADVTPILGPGASSSSTSSDNCTYTNSPATLTVGVQSGLSASQISTDEAGLQNAALVSWPPDENYRVYESSTGSGQEELWGFVNGTAVGMELTAPFASVAEQLAYLADVAYDRLFAVPVTRAQ